MKKDLSIQQRLAVSVLYVATLLALIFIFTRNFNFLTDGSPYNLIFVSAALLLVFGKYLTEPFFTKPVDTITNLTAIILTLLAVKDRSAFIAYDEFLWAAVALLGLALVSILSSNKIKPTWLDRLQRVIYLTVTTLGSSKWAFSVMYVLVLISFFTQRPAEFWILLTFFIFVITQFVYEDLVRYVTRVLIQLRQGETDVLSFQTVLKTYELQIGSSLGI